MLRRPPPPGEQVLAPILALPAEQVQELARALGEQVLVAALLALYARGRVLPGEQVLAHVLALPANVYWHLYWRT